jgi:predicted TIM-barrel fold metal-dependent hydrolase
MERDIPLAVWRPPLSRIIDIHTHVWPDAVAHKAVAGLVNDGMLTPFYDGTIAGLLAEMDRCGVDASVIQPVATKPSQVPSINNWVASIGESRIVPFGSMHPAFENPAEEIARIASLGLKGFKLHPEHQSFEPDEPRLAPIYEAGLANNLTILFHAGADEVHPGVHGTPESFAAVLDGFPGLRLVLAHMGGYKVWERVAEVLVGRDVYLDTAYTLGHLPDEDFVEMVGAHGADKVLFGSDGPWADQAVEVGRLRATGLDEHELALLLGGNAERILGV